MIDTRELKRLRERKHLSQRQLGLRAGVAGSAICRIEAGQRIPSLRLLVKIASVLGVHPGKLLAQSENGGGK